MSSMMEDKKIFLGSSIKYVSKINNSKRQLKEKRERSIKNITEKKFLYILIVILCLIIIILLYIIFFKKVKINSSVYPEPDDFLYYNTSEMDEPKSLFLYKEDHTEIKDKNKIRIYYCIDGNLIYPTLVSMAST